MSRTYRAIPKGIASNKEKHIKERFDPLCTKATKRFRKTKEELQRDNEAADAEYAEALKNAKPHHYYDWCTRTLTRILISGFREYTDWRGEKRKDPIEVRRKYVSRYRYETVEYTHEEQIKQLEQEYSTYTRDNRWNENSRNKGFKEQATTDLRNYTRRFIHLAMKDQLEDQAYPDPHIGDGRVWDFW